MSKFLNFLKYNNATVLILIAFFIVGSGVFAQTEAGQEFIGEQTTKVEGIDNAVLLAADLDNLAMDFKIEKIEEDDKYFYVTYTFINLANANNAWEYQLQEKNKKVSKKSNVDLGKYLAEEFSEEYLARLNELKADQAKAKAIGEEKRIEVTSYTGLIGTTLDLVSRAFPGYQSIKRNELPSPENFIPRQPTEEIVANAKPDNLTDVYNQYINENDPDNDNIFGSLDNCPTVANSDQLDTDSDGVGDTCDTDNVPVPVENVTPTEITEQPVDTTPAEALTPIDPTTVEPENVEIIDLPVSGPETPVSE